MKLSDKGAWIFALLWAVLPMLPALTSGMIAGSPFTDLYPSIWSLWATEDWLWHQKSTLLNFPHGQNWYPSNMLLGIVCLPFKPFIAMGNLYNCILICSRMLGAMSFYYAGLAHSNNRYIAWLWMIFIGCSPFVHGFAVEGILEGTQIWPIGFWLWAIQTQRYRWSAVLLCCTILSNWYFGAVLCTLCLWVGWKDHKVWQSFIGILPCLPLIGLFILGLDGHQNIPNSIRQSMGFQWGLPTPHIFQKESIFAINSHIGFGIIILTLLTLKQLKNTQMQWLILSAIAVFLASGWSPLYDFFLFKPLLGLFRFPYRWHLLLLIALAHYLTENPLWTSRKSTLWIFAILLEQSLLASVSWFIPTAPKNPDSYVHIINAPILDLPGPQSKAAGTANPSRSRLRYVLYNQTFHQQPSGWSLDFNSLHETSSCFQETHSSPPLWDDLDDNTKQCWQNIEWVVIHNNSHQWDRLLEAQNFEVFPSTSHLSIWKRNHAP